MTLAHVTLGCDDEIVEPAVDMSSASDMLDQDDMARRDMPDASPDLDGSDLSQDLGLDMPADMEVDMSAAVLCDTVVEASQNFEFLFLDDVSVAYSTNISPTVEPDYGALTLLFETYSPDPDIGVFELGAGGRDANFGNCSHCVYFRGATPDRAYFANGGTLETRVDPYSRELDVIVKNLTLIPVSLDPLTRESTPVAGGKCVQVKDFTHKEVFAPSGWTCEASRYKDGESCDCECGSPDPDCNPPNCPLGDPLCQENYTPLPIVGCQSNELCAFNPEMMDTVCVAECDWKERTPCGAGTCLFTQRGAGEGEPDLCVVSTQRFVNRAVGEPCTDPGDEPTGLQLYCAVDAQGFAMGYCANGNICRAVCQQDSECTEPGHLCRRFVDDTSLGFCGTDPFDDEDEDG